MIRLERPLRRVLFPVGAGLSLVDAGFTLGLRGTFHEVNPLLGALLPHPVLFLLAKVVLTLGGMGILMRSGTWIADLLLLTAVAAYCSVDGYWLLHTLA